VDFGARFFIRDYLAIMLTSVVRHFLISREFRTSPRDVFVWQIVSVCMRLFHVNSLFGRRSWFWQVSGSRGASARLLYGKHRNFIEMLSAWPINVARPWILVRNSNYQTLGTDTRILALTRDTLTRLRDFDHIWPPFLSIPLYSARVQSVPSATVKLIIVR